jgi:phage gpG-like protein
MLRLRFQLDSALDRLQHLSDHLQDVAALLAPAVPVVAAAIQRNFEEEGRPERWPPLSPGYALWKAARYPGRKILERTGALRSSIRVGIEPTVPAALVASTDVPYAAAHQFGMPQRNLPPRPFLVLTDEDREEVAQAIADALEER